jgi:hypothetical protein
VTGSVVALALGAGVIGFDDGFVVIALLLLPILLFVGISTFRRLIEINREDVRWVVGMNRPVPLSRGCARAPAALRDWLTVTPGLRRPAPGPRSHGCPVP